MSSEKHPIPLKHPEPFPADANTHCFLPHNTDMGSYGLTLYGTTSSNRPTLKHLPQTPAKVVASPLPNPDGEVDLVSYYHNFQELVEYLASVIGQSLQDIGYHYTIIENYYSDKCHHWADDGIGRPPRGSGYFENTFPKCMTSSGFTVDHHMYELCQALDRLKNIPLQESEDTIGWDGFWNQWPPLSIDRQYILVSTPFDTHISNPIRGKGREVTEIKGGKVTLTVLMDTQGYRIPRGFTLDVQGVEYYIRIEDEDVDPSSSSSSSSAYSSNPYGG